MGDYTWLGDAGLFRPSSEGKEAIRVRVNYKERIYEVCRVDLRGEGVVLVCSLVIGMQSMLLRRELDVLIIWCEYGHLSGCYQVDRILLEGEGAGGLVWGGVYLRRYTYI